MSQTLLSLIASRVQAALAAAGCADADPAVQVASRVEYGDYQANGIMGAAKARGLKPRALAQAVLENLDLAEIAETVEIAGPGFINIRLSAEFLQKRLTATKGRIDLAVPSLPASRVIIDYSSPNLAKEMHVGHLRSTILGDSLARILRFLGQTVIAQNHVGDWGTQFGMLTAFLMESSAELESERALSDLEGFYRRAKARFDADPAFADRAREYVVKLQAGDAEVLGWWKQFRTTSLEHCQAMYDLLGVQLTSADIRGESAYNPELAPLVAELVAKGIASLSEGAKLVFLPEFLTKDGGPSVYMIQKSDGGYPYATTDLAAVRYRVKDLAADRVLYVVDARQHFHFRQFFAVARLAAYVPGRVTLEHIDFGMVLGSDGRPFKTRSGESVKLQDLLTEAQERAYQVVSTKSPNLSEAARLEIGRVVGIGAIKYFDLSKNRSSDYLFDWDSMLSFHGNTAPYLQYAYTRIQSIFRGVENFDALAPLILADPTERLLALQLAQFGEVLHRVAEESMPHYLCQYLYDLATRFMSFYEVCPVLKAEEVSRASRLQLSRLTADTLRIGLGLLGIETLDQM